MRIFQDSIGNKYKMRMHDYEINKRGKMWITDEKNGKKNITGDRCIWPKREKKNKNTRYKGTTHFLIRYAQFIRSVVSKRFFIIVMNMYSNIIEEKWERQSRIYLQMNTKRYRAGLDGVEGLERQQRNRHIISTDYCVWFQRTTKDSA